MKFDYLLINGAMAMKAGRVKILFELIQDADGYPPVAAEGMWGALLESGNVLLDSIPFYATGVSLGDELQIKTDADGEKWFLNVAVPSGNSTFRLIVSDVKEIENIRNDILRLGCESEVNLKVWTIAFVVPATTDIHPVLDYIVDRKESGKLDYEEAALRHRI